MNANQLTDDEFAQILLLDLWNEHRYQIEAIERFYGVLDQNLLRGEAIGDEPALSSGLIHSRTLFEFYDPRLVRDSAETVYWRTGLGHEAGNDSWQTLSGKAWNEVQPWRKGINTFLGHISADRRELVLPNGPDSNNQRWPLVLFAERSLNLLSAYVELLRDNGQRTPVVLEAAQQVESRTHELWTNFSPRFVKHGW